jgi:hypothetical protein
VEIQKEEHMPEQEDCNHPQIKLDGSYGYGVQAELTIYTKNPEGGRKEETFTIPYMLIDFSKLHAIDYIHLILGYSICKLEKPDQLKSLGLA